VRQGEEAGGRRRGEARRFRGAFVAPIAAGSPSALLLPAAPPQGPAGIRATHTHTTHTYAHTYRHKTVHTSTGGVLRVNEGGRANEMQVHATPGGTAAPTQTLVPHGPTRMPYRHNNPSPRGGGGGRGTESEPRPSGTTRQRLRHGLPLQLIPLPAAKTTSRALLLCGTACREEAVRRMHPKRHLPWGRGRAAAQTGEGDSQCRQVERARKTDSQAVHKKLEA